MVSVDSAAHSIRMYMSDERNCVIEERKKDFPSVPVLTYTVAYIRDRSHALYTYHAYVPLI